MRPCYVRLIRHGRRDHDPVPRTQCARRKQRAAAGDGLLDNATDIWRARYCVAAGIDYPDKILQDDDGKYVAK